MNHINYKEILPEVIEIVREAGREVYTHYLKGVEIQSKADFSPVTSADKASHAVVIQGLSKYGIPILSEEQDEDDLSRLSSKHIFIVDPLDGTKDFIRGTGDYSVMVGLACEGIPVMGVVYEPAKDILYYSHSGGGAYMEKDGCVTQLRVVEPNKNTNLMASRAHFTDDVTVVANELEASIVRAGSIGVKIGYIARGDAHLFVNCASGMGEWDACAPHAILKEAGGIFSGKDGSELTYNKRDPRTPQGIVAGVGDTHTKALSVLASLEE